MRDFAYKPQVNDDPIDVPTDVEGHPVYQESVLIQFSLMSWKMVHTFRMI